MSAGTVAPVLSCEGWGEWLGVPVADVRRAAFTVAIRTDGGVFLDVVGDVIDADALPRVLRELAHPGYCVL